MRPCAQVLTRRGVQWEFPIVHRNVCCCLAIKSGQVKPLPNDCAVKGLKEQSPVIYRERIEQCLGFMRHAQRRRSFTGSEINVPQMKNKSEGLDHMLRLYVFNCRGRGALGGTAER